MQNYNFASIFCVYVNKTINKKMKTIFDKTYIMANRGCYEHRQVDDIPFNDDNEITLKELFDYLPIRDFTWFLVMTCELSTKEKQLFALHCASYVAPIYRKYYPNDSRVDDCIKATKQFLDGEITIDELQEKRAAAAAASAAAYTAYTADAAEREKQIKLIRKWLG